MSDNKKKREGGLPGIKILYLVILLVISALLVINYEINYDWVKGFREDLESKMIPDELVGELTDEVGRRLMVFLFGNVGIILFLLGLLFILKKANDELKERYFDINSAKEEIEEEQKRTTAIIANLVDPVLVVNNKGELLLFNPAASKIFGILAEDIGKKVISGQEKFTFDVFKDIIKKEYHSKIIEEDKKKNPLLEEVVIIGKDGTNEESPFTSILNSKYQKGSSFFKVATAPIYDYNGKKYGQMKICYDLTREKTIDQMKSEFISIIAHQLRTPLSAVKWVFKMMADGDAGKLTPEQEKLANRGYESNERIIRLINDLLDATFIEEGRYGYNFNNYKIQDVIGDLLVNIEKEKKVKLVSEINHDIPEMYFDKLKISLAIGNVIKNAISYTPENGTIYVSADINKEKNQTEIVIRDNGVGIPENEQKRVFGKFFRAKNVIRMQTEGSGLGLFIAKNIIEKHNGKISFESEDGKGTTFNIILPFKT